MDLHAYRSAHARELSQQRSDRVRAGIRRAIPLAIKLHALSHRGTATWVRNRIVKFGPEKFGLAGVPDLEIVSREVRILISERLALLVSMESDFVSMKSAQARFILSHSSSVSST